MKILLIFFFFQSLLLSINAQPIQWKNRWTEAPSRIPNSFSTDAPLMGNGDITMTLGYKENLLRYYLTENDFWRLLSQAPDQSGPRLVGFVDLKIEGYADSKFTAEQLLSNGLTTCNLQKNNSKIEVKSWVSATENLIFLELNAKTNTENVTIKLSAPENKQALLETGEDNGIYWLTRSFTEGVDIATEVSVGLKCINNSSNTIVLEPGKKTIVAISVKSKFKTKNTKEHVINKLLNLNGKCKARFFISHVKWWNNFWAKSSVSINDSVLLKSYYQGLYTMASCSRDPKFPPGIFGWNTTDSPAWNGDYHLNYNFQAPFYGLYAANRLEQAESHDSPLLDFMPRGEWYAQKATNTRGIMYPVGIGPLGIEVSRNFSPDDYTKATDIESEGLFYGQRTNAAYGLVNMAQQWRCTYDIEYAKKIYPYALGVVNFWEDYLIYENGRYVIYGDAIHEGSGKDKNPILSLGLVRNAFDLIVNLSSTLKIDENRQEKWNDILNKLSDFPTQIRNGKEVFRYTEDGVAWWNDNGLGIQHIYPANAINLDSKIEVLSVALNTIDEMKRWQDQNTSNSFFVAAIRVGYNPTVILDELHKYALHTYPNGFQLNNPHGIENSCTVANALMEMMCMSAGHVIRLFSGFPEGHDASFINIRTWGAFLISARMTKGIVSDVKIISEAGKPLTIVNPWKGKLVHVMRKNKKPEYLSGEKITIETISNEIIELKPI